MTVKQQWQNTIDSVKDKTDAEAVAKAFNDFNTKTAGVIDELVASKQSSEAEITALQKEIIGIKDEQLKQLNEALKVQGLAITKMKNSGTKKKESLKDQLLKNLEAIKAIKNGKLKDGLEFKVPATMLLSTNVSGGNIPVEDRITGLNIVPSRPIRLLDVMAKRNTTSNVVSWVYQANKDGAAGQTAEGAAKNQIDFDLVVASEAVKKSTAYIKVSDEMLDDIDYIESEINNELLRELLKVVEAQAYEGDGTGQNHNGIRTVASAFAAGTFANSVDNANIVDVLTAACNQIKVAQETMVTPNYIFMHPTDVTSLKFEKVSSTDKRYVERLQQIGSTMLLDGNIPIIETTLVTVGEYLVGAFDLSLLVTRSEVDVQIGYDSDDFTKNLRTIRAEWRGCTIVKNNDRTAFVAGVFATDQAALETP